MSHITVKAEREETNGSFKTVLWERSAAHPNQEIYIVTDGKEHRVGQTDAVKKLLMTGRLVKVAEPTKSEKAK